MSLPAVPEGLPDPLLRIAASQRDHAIGLLREAAGDARITFDELNSRLPIALSAITRLDLYRVLADIVPAADLAAVVAQAQPAGEGAGWHWDEPLFLDQRRIVGAWDIPPFVEVLAPSFGVVKLDLCQATPMAGVIDLVVTASSMVTVVVPEGWGVDLQQIEVNGSAAKSSKVRTRPDPGQPRIILRGSAPWGVTVRHPSWWDLRAQRAWAREHPSQG